MSSAEGDSGHVGAGAAVYRRGRAATGTGTVSEARNCSLIASLASQIELAGEKRHPDREPPRRRRRLRRRTERTRPRAAPRNTKPFSAYSPATRTGWRQTNRIGRRQRAERAAAVLDHEPDVRVVEEHVDEHQREPEREIESESPHEDLALDAEDPRALDEPLEKQPAVHVGEEPPVHDSRYRRQSQQSKEVTARGGEESVGPRRPLPRVAIDDAAGEERPAREVEAERAGDRERPRAGRRAGC